MMKTRLNGTERPKKDAGGLRHGLLVLAVLLLTCVLMAGAVSAKEVPVDNWNDLKNNLTEPDVDTIKLTGDIYAEAQVNVTNPVTIEGNYHTITPADGVTWGKDNADKHLIQVTSKSGPVTLQNLTLDSKGKAADLHVYDTGADNQIVLKNLLINGSKEMGLHVNAANVSATNLTIRNSGWKVGIDVQKGKSLTTTSSLYIDTLDKIEDPLQISDEEFTKGSNTASVYIDGTETPAYLAYTSSKDGTSYGLDRNLWLNDATVSKFAAAKVVNTSGPVALHTDLAQALTSYVDAGSTVTQLQDIALTEPITIDEAITFDGSKKKISGRSTTGYFLMVAVPLAENPEKSVTLQNLNLDISSIGGGADLGGITVRANEDKDESVPVTLKDSIVDMGDVDMTGTTSMNPAVYFVNASKSQITNNEITAGAASSSSTRCVVVDGGSDVTVSGNTLTLGTADEGAVSIGVQIKGPNPNDVTVTGNTITAPDDSATKSIAVDITTTGKAESHSITGNTISAEGSGKFDSAIRVLLSSAISDEKGGSLGITVSGNTVTNAEKGVYIMAGSPGAQGKQLTLTGTINEDDFRELSSRHAILASDPELPNQPITDSVVWTHNPEPSYSSSSGNMDNAYRVLFNDGATTLSVQTDLSSGDKLTKPETPVKDGYTFAGWYKDSACTQAWDFETGIPGDMTLYAKWTAAGSSGETEATATPTKTQTAVTTPQPTKTQSTTATTSAPEATTAAGVSPTLTQAPAPVAGALFGLLAAGVLLRRRFQ